MPKTQNPFQSKGKKNLADGQKARKIRIKKGDTVMLIAGKDKGKTGTIRSILYAQNKAVVEGLNMMKKAVRPNPMTGQRGGIVEMEAPIHISNLMYYDLKISKPTRIKTATIKSSDGKEKRVRVSLKSGEQLDV